MDLFSNDYRKHSYKRKIYSEEASRVGSNPERQSSYCLVVE